MKRSWVRVNFPPPSFSLSLSLPLRPISLIFTCWFISSRGHWAMQQICALIPFMSPPLIYNLEVFHIEAAKHLYHKFPATGHHVANEAAGRDSTGFPREGSQVAGESTTPTCSMSRTLMKQKLTKGNDEGGRISQRNPKWKVRSFQNPNGPLLSPIWS